MKQWKVITPSYEESVKEIIVDDDWLDAIPRKGIAELTLLDGGKKLEVKYANGNSVFYQNIHGTWGFPTVFE
jgi:hypothetical protein